MKNITVILPAYNERKNIEALVPEIFKYAPEVSVMVVDDNSPDGTGRAVEELRMRFPKLSIFRREKKEGLGKAYRDAFKKILEDSSIEAVVMMDADFSHYPHYISPLLEEGSAYDVVIGSRYVTGGATQGWELWRRILSRWGNMYCRRILGLPIRDCTGGFNFIRTSILKKIDFNRFDNSGYAFQIELKYELFKLGARFSEIPIVFKNRFEGESKISSHIIREGVLAPWKLKLRK